MTIVQLHLEAAIQELNNAIHELETTTPKERKMVAALTNRSEQTIDTYFGFAKDNIETALRNIERASKRLMIPVNVDTN